MYELKKKCGVGNVCDVCWMLGSDFVLGYSRMKIGRCGRCRRGRSRFGDSEE